jgi:hypothetical protein
VAEGKGDNGLDGVKEVDLGNAFAHEGLEVAEKLGAIRTRAESGVMEAEAVVGRMGRLCAAASIREGEVAERSVGDIDALARHGGSSAFS